MCRERRRFPRPCCVTTDAEHRAPESCLFQEAGSCPICGLDFFSRPGPLLASVVFPSSTTAMDRRARRPMAVAAITARTRRARERRRKRPSSTGSRRPPPPRPLPRRSASGGCGSGRGTRRTAATPTLARNTSCRCMSRPGAPASSRDPSFSTTSPWATCRWLAWGSGPVAGRARRKAGMMRVSALRDRVAPSPPAGTTWLL